MYIVRIVLINGKKEITNVLIDVKIQIIRKVEKNLILSKLKFQCPNCKSEIEYNNVEKHHNSCKIQGKKKMKKIDKKEVEKLNKNKDIITKIKSKKYI